jgi:hypothetical protein
MTIAVLCAAFDRSAEAQWASFVDETASRLSASSSLGVNDTREKDYAWDDLDDDGDTDLVSVRKEPFTHAGGFQNVLFMNESGVLIDRTSTLANTALGVPAGEGVSNGMLDATNDRDVVIVDVNNDGWKDVVTATTISDGLPRYIGHPRVYINMGEVGGVWQGLRYEYERIPQLITVTGLVRNPRFCSLAAGDLTGDGYADLYFGDYDGGQFTPNEPAGNDMDNKLLINMGAANPGVFVDESVLRMGTMFTYDVGSFNYLYAKFGAAAVIADMNGDGVNDVVKHTSLQNPIHIAVMTNRNPPVDPPGPECQFAKYKIVYNLTGYFVSAGDLNNDGRLDLVVTDDGLDRYLLNTSNDAQDQPNFSQFVLTGSASGDFGSQNVAVDLDNDGWKDVLVADVDVDEESCSRRSRIFRNQGNAPNVTIAESGTLIPNSEMTGVHQFGAFDINNDGWTDLVIGRCSGTKVWMNAGMQITLPNGTPPGQANPDGTTTFQVQAIPQGGGVIAPGTARLYVSVNGGAYTDSPLTLVGKNLYQATLPAGACGDSLRYYVSVQFTSTGGTQLNTLTLPTGAPASFFSALRATSLELELLDEIEGSVAAWTVPPSSPSTGAWEAAVPVGTFNGGVPAAPASDATPRPGTRAFVTGNGTGGAAGATDIDGTTVLATPTFDSTENGRVSYNYWFYRSLAGPSLTIAVSNNDGSTWTNVKTITANTGPGGSGGAWVADAFIVGDYLAPTPQTKVRFTAVDTSGSITEAALDDFRVDVPECGAACPADVNGSGAVDADDLVAVVLAWGPCPAPPAACDADVDDSGVVDADDLVAVVLGWGACK